MYPSRLNKFHYSYADRAIAEEDRRTHEGNRCHNKNKDISRKVNLKKDYSIKPHFALRTASETAACSDLMVLPVVHDDSLQ